MLSISRLSGEKNLTLLLNMMNLLDERFHLTIVGDGPDGSKLKNKAKSLNLKEKVSFIGWVANTRLGEIIEKNDIFISASAFETFGLTYVETLAGVLPLVVYDYKVTREIIPRGMGLFVDSLDPYVWAENLERLYDNPQVYESLKNNIKADYEKILNYREDRSTENLIEIYRSIILK